jgi:hypothetical protein
VEQVEMRRLRERRDNIPSKECSVMLRINYILNQMDDNTIKQILIRQDKSKIWSHEALEIYFTWCQGIKERLRTLCYSVNGKFPPKEESREILVEMIELTRLTNYNLHNIKLSYGGAVHYIDLKGWNNSNWTSLDRYIYPIKAKRFTGTKEPTRKELHIFKSDYGRFY